jgi:hypothetical protein
MSFLTTGSRELPAQPDWDGAGKISSGLGGIGVQPKLERLERLVTLDSSDTGLLTGDSGGGVFNRGTGNGKRLVGDSFCWR